MNAKHTPGPWRSTPCRDIVSPAAVTVTDNGLVAALCSDRPVGEVDANARLIAAAPDLLAALRDAEREMRFLTQQLAARGLPGVPGDTVDRVMAAVRAAIAKAEGGEP